MKKNEIILKQILSYCYQIDDANSMFDNSFESFIENSVYHNACCMCILQIGEQCKRISDEFRQNSENIPWDDWCGIRDIFAHQYTKANFESAWTTIQEDLPKLKEFCEKFLKKKT